MDTHYARVSIYSSSTQAMHVRSLQIVLCSFPSRCFFSYCVALPHHLALPLCLQGFLLSRARSQTKNLRCGELCRFGVSSFSFLPSRPNTGPSWGTLRPPPHIR